MIFKTNSSYEQGMRLVTLITFIVLGLPIMIITFFGDCIYFWKNNFRKKQEGEGDDAKRLTKIIIDVP